MKNRKFKIKNGLPCGAGAKWGVTLYIAITIMSLLLFVSFAVVNVTIKGTLFATSGRDSQFAFFAADAGAECAMYWDITENKFATSSDGGSIDCAESTSITDGGILGTTTLALIGGGGDGGATTPDDIEEVNTATGSATGSGNSISTNAFNTGSGNLIVAAIRYNKGTGSLAISSVTDTVGNVYNFAVGMTHTGNDRLEIWYAKNTGPHASNVVRVNFSRNVSYRIVNTIQYSGVDQGSPLDATAISTTQTSGTITSNSFTTTSADEVIVAAAQISTTGSNWTSGAGYAKQIEDSPSRIVMVEDKYVSSIQNNVTATAVNSNTSARKNIIVATFKAASTESERGPTSVFGFTMNQGLSPTQSCAIVTINKKYVGVPEVLQTHIESRGYNTCNPNNPRRVERGVEITY